MSTAFVFIAGIDGTTDLFEPWEPHLRAMGYDVLIYNHEHRASPDQCPSLHAFADEVAALMDNRGVQKAIICGESFGGPIAFTFARHYPERVCALVLLATFAYLPFPRRAWIARKFGKLLGPAARLVPNSAVRLARRIYNPSSGRHEPPEFRRILTAKRTASVAAYLAKSCLALNYDARPWLPDFPWPALVLTGERDRLISPACSDELATLLPHATLVRIPNSGHLSHYAYPDAFWNALTPFLEELRLPQPVASASRR